MVEKGDHVPLGRKTRMAYPTSGLVEYFPDRILQAASAGGMTHYREGVPIGRPIGPLDILQNFAGRPADQRHPSQSSAEGVRIGLMAAEQYSHLSCGRDGHDLGIRKTQGP